MGGRPVSRSPPLPVTRGHAQSSFQALRNSLGSHAASQASPSPNHHLSELLGGPPTRPPNPTPLPDPRGTVGVILLGPHQTLAPPRVA